MEDPSVAQSFEHVLAFKIIPVVALEREADAPALADALVQGGLPCAEITFRTDAAAGAIRALAGRHDFTVGAGTVLTAEQARQAMDCGAAFVVAPGLSPTVVRLCRERDVPVLPGVCTPSDITLAHEKGLDLLKFFPAEAFGGVKTLDALGGPFPKVRFVPTGGIGPGNLREYLRHPRVAACGGSWMVAPKLIAAGRFDEVARLSQEAVRIASEACSP
jgi:2-dehydro-3-deoxyphosphogluconate aldolase/(4S)-4-hydroxy-2-oxoglutarate aldolase